jgi:hypothetical protein
MSQDMKGEKAPATASTAPAAQKRTYTVANIGSVSIGGNIFGPGAEVQLSAEEAASLGTSVFPGKAKPVDDFSKRKAGMYQVAAERNLCKDGKFLGPGELLDLNAQEAQKLGDAIEPAA